MTGLPLALQALIWTYVIVASGAILACVWSMWAGLATGRHRRSRLAPLLDLGAALARFPADVRTGLENAAEFLFWGRSA